MVLITYLSSTSNYANKGFIYVSTYLCTVSSHSLALNKYLGGEEHFGWWRTHTVNSFPCVLYCTMMFQEEGQ